MSTGARCRWTIVWRRPTRRGLEGEAETVPEGLSAIEANKELQHHQHLETEERGKKRWLQITEGVVLAIVTLTAAWSGFAAAKWGTESRLQLAAAATARTEANRAEYTALSIRNYDASTFNAWFTAYTLDNAEKMTMAERRFRPPFKRAFDAWIATNPATNPHSPPGPTYMPQYVLPETAHAAALDRVADRQAKHGTQDGIVADNYVRITVVLAGVLFLIGIGSTFALLGVRYGLLTVGVLLLLAAVAMLAMQPAPPS